MAINLNKQMESMSNLLVKDQVSNDDTLSMQDKYDLKAYQFNAYFPVPEKKKTED